LLALYVPSYTPSCKKRADGSWEEYTRAGVRKLRDFIGWPTILRLLWECRNTHYYANPKDFRFDEEERLQLREALCIRDQALLATAFLTGGRISETLMLHADNFIVERERIVVREMPLLKRYTLEKEELWTSPTPPTRLRRGEDYRWDKGRGLFVIEHKVSEVQVAERGDFPIPLWEQPLAGILLRRIEWARRERERVEGTAIGKRRGGRAWLFPSPYKTKRKESVGVQKWIEDMFELRTRPWVSPQKGYKVSRMVGERIGLTGASHLFNHWWRSQRASQLKEDYQLEEPQLEGFFSWAIPRGKTSREYTQVGLRGLWRWMVAEKGRVEDIIATARIEVLHQQF